MHFRLNDCMKGMRKDLKWFEGHQDQKDTRIRSPIRQYIVGMKVLHSDF